MELMEKVVLQMLNLFSTKLSGIYYPGVFLMYRLYFSRLFYHVKWYVFIAIMLAFAVLIVYFILKKIISNRNISVKPKSINEINTIYDSSFVLHDQKFNTEDKNALEFFIKMNHEFRTPLNLILSSLQLISKRITECNHENNDYLMKRISIIRTSSYRMLRTSENIMDMKKIAHGYYSLCIQSCDIVKIVKTITYNAIPHIKKKNIAVEFNSEIMSKAILCDAYAIERILLNLLSNATKYTHQGGRIVVSVFEQGGYILISVKDNGIGVPAKMQKKIFRYDSDNDKVKLCRDNEGCGIGLNIAKSLVSMHGGTLYLNKTYKEGSEFIVSLPCKSIENDNTYVCKPVDTFLDRVSIEFSDVYNNQ